MLRDPGPAGKHFRRYTPAASSHGQDPPRFMLPTPCRTGDFFKKRGFFKKQGIFSKKCGGTCIPPHLSFLYRKSVFSDLNQYFISENSLPGITPSETLSVRRSFIRKSLHQGISSSGNLFIRRSLRQKISLPVSRSASHTSPDTWPRTGPRRSLPSWRARPSCSTRDAYHSRPAPHSGSRASSRGHCSWQR